MKKTLSISMLLLFLTTSCNSSRKLDFDNIKNLNFENVDLVYTLEYGDTIDLKQLKYEILMFETDYEIPNFNSLEIGEKKYNFKMNNYTVNFNLIVEDTQAPQFYGEDSFSVYLNEKLDLDKLVKAKDPVDGDVKVEFEGLDTSKLGKQIVNATAKDKNGLVSTKKLEVNVKERPKAQTKPVSEGNKNSNDPQDNYDYDASYKRSQQQIADSLKTKNTYFYEVDEPTEYVFSTSGAVNGKSVLIVLEFDNGKSSPMTAEKCYTFSGAGDHVNISLAKTRELAAEQGYNINLNSD